MAEVKKAWKDYLGKEEYVEQAQADYRVYKRLLKNWTEGCANPL
eukprot:CAMPEP_0170505782 /NCGR_PEP_ID=MMETSP0208-20121228/52227_1 /TAXON_ID=197538 /ORGANISM="Strombidium inclinatum, Strain S3" /LENGTH=43 /DNA_ID= /DNA_START= /DNA_END= /DNA_ORIENTATION=